MFDGKQMRMQRITADMRTQYDPVFLIGRNIDIV